MGAGCPQACLTCPQKGSRAHGRLRTRQRNPACGFMGPGWFCRKRKNVFLNLMLESHFLLISLAFYWALLTPTHSERLSVSFHIRISSAGARTNRAFHPTARASWRTKPRTPSSLRQPEHTAEIRSRWEMSVCCTNRVEAVFRETMKTAPQDPKHTAGVSAFSRLLGAAEVFPSFRNGLSLEMVTQSVPARDPDRGKPGSG